MGDPLDPQSPLMFDFMDRLIEGMTSPEARVAFTLAFHTIHSKLTIIDDAWASIGSSNCMRRSFYMDGEISVSVLDEVEPSFAAHLRKDLWGEHCGLAPGPDRDVFLVLNDALGIWKRRLGRSARGDQVKGGIQAHADSFQFRLSPVPDDSFGAEGASMAPARRDVIDGDSRLEY